MELLILILPPAIVVFLFAYCPLPGIVLAFKDFSPRDGIWGSEWIGFDNFDFLFIRGKAFTIIRNTVLLNVTFIILGIVVNVMVALLLFEITNKRLVKTYYTILIFPNFLSWIVVGFMSFSLLNVKYGMLNTFLQNIGLEPVSWYMKPMLWPFILAIAHVWKHMGMGSVIYYSTLVSIDPEMYEAATIDGASRFQMAKYISIPSLVPMITILFIMAMGRIINADFGMFYFLTRDVPLLYKVTDVIDTFVFRSLMYNSEIGMASAAGLFQSVIGFFMVLGTNFVVRKIAPDNALF